MTGSAKPVEPRVCRHLKSIMDGREHVFLDHELARSMAWEGWIYLNPGSGNYCITEAGRELVANE